MIHWGFLILAFIVGFACCYGLKKLQQKQWRKLAAAIRGLRADKTD